MIIVAQISDELESAFKHELCSYPPALFDSSLLLREAHKPAVADAIWVLLGADIHADVPNKDDSRYVLDGEGTYSTNHMVSLIYMQMHRQPVHLVCNA